MFEGLKLWVSPRKHQESSFQLVLISLLVVFCSWGACLETSHKKRKTHTAHRRLAQQPSTERHAAPTKTKRGVYCCPPSIAPFLCIDVVYRKQRSPLIGLFYSGVSVALHFLHRFATPTFRRGSLIYSSASRGGGVDLCSAAFVLRANLLLCSERRGRVAEVCFIRASVPYATKRIHLVLFRFCP